MTADPSFKSLELSLKKEMMEKIMAACEHKKTPNATEVERVETGCPRISLNRKPKLYKKIPSKKKDNAQANLVFIFQV